MDRKHLGRLLWVLPLAVIVVYLLDRYVWISAQEEVERFIERCRRAVESRSVLRCEPLLASDFVTGSGMGRGEFLYFARVHFAQLRELHAEVKKTEITLSEDEAEAEVRLQVLLAGTNQDGSRWLGIRDRTRLEPVFLRVKKRNGDWKAVYADWEDSRPVRLR